MTEKKEIKKRNYDLKMESAIIGYMLYDLSTAKWVATIMDPEWFYASKNRFIFEVIKEKADDNIAPDINLVCKWLSDKGILGDCGGTEHLNDCFGELTTPAHTAQYIKELRQLYFDRNTVVLAHAMVECPSVKNMELLKQNYLDQASANSSNITDFSESIDMIAELTTKREHGLYDTFGKNLEESDKVHNGMELTNILTIGSRPGVGKTVMSTQIIRAFAGKYKEPALYFSTEMPKEETLTRILMPMTQIASWKFRKREFSQEDIREIIKAGEKLTKMKILVNDKPSPTIEDIRAGILSTKAKLVVIDYIQRLRMPKARMRNEALEAIMVAIKNMARDIGCMIIVLSQLDRETDHLTGKGRPQLADLKGSGAIEAESDAVALMWRFNKKDKLNPKKKLVADIKGIRPVELIWAKNRHGQSDVSIQLIFDEAHIEFREWKKEDRPEIEENKNEKPNLPIWNEKL